MVNEKEKSPQEVLLEEIEGIAGTLRAIRRWVTFFGIVVLLALIGGCWMMTKAFAGTASIAEVIDVYDGDTLTVELDGVRERVRLIGIDAPEIRGPAHELALAAGAYLASLVAGETVDLVLGVKGRDRYGRLLAYVYLDGLFINLEMVRAGCAVTYTVPPDVAHANEFLEAEREARANRQGLWNVNQQGDRDGE